MLAIICFGAIQLSGSVLLRHKAVSVLEIGTLDYMLGNVREPDLAEHIKGIATEFELIGGTVRVDPETISNANFLRVEISLPINENLVTPMIIESLPELKTQVLIYKP